ncbi:hypothetical protein [Afipia felis]
MASAADPEFLRGSTQARPQEFQIESGAEIFDMRVPLSFRS